MSAGIKVKCFRCRKRPRISILYCEECGEFFREQRRALGFCGICIHRIHVGRCKVKDCGCEEECRTPDKVTVTLSNCATIQRMDKKQAAVYLGKKLNSDGSPISERSVERYIVRFNVPVTRRNVVGADGRKHKVVDISRAELDRIVEQAREAAEEGTMTQPAGSQALAVRPIPPVLTALLDRPSTHR